MHIPLCKEIFEDIGVKRKIVHETHLFEGDAEILLKFEEHEYISAHRLVSPHLYGFMDVAN